MTVTIREAFARASSFLHARGVDDSGRNAELLMQHVFGWPRSKLFASWSDPFPEDMEERWEMMLSRRAAGEPVQYLLKDQPFYGMSFEVTPAVLIPRPETELLVEHVLGRGDAIWPEGDGTPPSVVDVGAGSGAISVTLAALRPRWRVSAVDISPEALAVAQANAERNGARVEWLHGKWLAPVIQAAQKVDILVSNPPYIPSGEIPFLQREVRDWEPHLALDGGPDGLEPYRILTAQLKELPDGGPRLVGFEVGAGQAEQVAELLREAGPWREIDIVKDYSGISRHVLAWR